MKKTNFIAFIFMTLVLFLLPLSNWQLRAESEGDKSIDEVLQEIRISQGIGANDQVVCDKLTDEQLEELGDIVMGVMIGDEKQHELMDQMMGGEGSSSLRARHIMIGSRYLGCFSGNMMGIPGGMMGMMNGIGYLDNFTISNNWKGGIMGMMNGWNGFGFGLGWIFMLIFWAVILGLFVLGVVALSRWIIKPATAEKTSKTPLDILKERYARGEIDKKEFTEKKKDLE